MCEVSLEDFNHIPSEFFKNKNLFDQIETDFQHSNRVFQNTEQMGKSKIRHFVQKSQQYVKALLTIYIFQLYCKSPRCLFIQGCNGRDILNRDKVNLYFGQAAIHLKNCSECAISFLCTKCLEESYEGHTLYCIFACASDPRIRFCYRRFSPFPWDIGTAVLLPVAWSDQSDREPYSSSHLGEWRGGIAGQGFIEQV